MKRFRNAMVDIECLSLMLGAGILQVGVALFDIEPDADAIITRSFPVRIEPGNDMSDPDTLQFWQVEAPALYAQLVEVSKSAPSLRVTFEMLAEHLAAHGVEQVWSNRAAFDIGQLKHASERLGIPAPWRFNRIRDGASIVQMVEDLTGARPVCPKPEGFVAHDAEWDALHQARVVRAAYARMREHMAPLPLRAVA